MNPTHNALIVDDERDIRELVALTLGRMGLRAHTAANLSQARELLGSTRFDLCLTDMRLPDGDGLDLVREIARDYPHTPVAMITAFGDVQLAVDALKSGAFDFISKPVDISVLRKLAQHALKLNQNHAPMTVAENASRLLGQSHAMNELRATITKVARSQAPVYILGESGTGKELVARTIHEQGARVHAPFVPINCGAIPSELMESEFFGHKRGSFTGATADKPGLFQAAHGGTLFLDEVAELPLPMQVKLLRAIQEKTVRPVGAANEVSVDVRILSATHKDLADLVQEGRFRHDLYYRLNVIELRVPPLRQRREDLPQLAQTVLTRLAREQHVDVPQLSEAALVALSRYHFPGNVRELENILERALALAEGQSIGVEDLRLPQHTPMPLVTTAPAAVPASASPTEASETYTLPLSTDLPSSLEEAERATIQKALEANRWNRTRTAAQLGITFRSLRYKLKKLGME